MKSLDRAIKRDRNKRCRTIKKLFKARDAASKYIKTDMPISFLLRMVGHQSAGYMTTAAIAKLIVDNGDLWLNKPPAPPKQGKPSMTILPSNYPGPLQKREPDPPKGPEPIIGRRK
ncbi:hypothetical protein ACQKDB_15995 [Planococcus kocurii]|uniref:hypothetical protein n=1 Tax=Planococcus kocurii TaxID=1374 RepID=UPI003D04D178